MKTLRILAVSIMALVLFSGIANATPSTQIWIPSTDIQPYKIPHYGFDSYIGTKGNGITTNVGLTVGVLPFEKVQMEAGIDYRDADGTHDSPMLFNAKLGVPEGVLFEGSPAVAVGGYDFGTEKGVSNYNIYYGLVAKSFDSIGRLSAGYYVGNDKVLVDIKGEKDNTGILLSWDRTISEVSDKLWAAIDYQGGNNSYGALSFGVAWKFASNVGVIVGYDIYNESSTKPTATLQLDIDF
ncbi:FIG00678269: hypothetical protein [hydrothermal vent metagenome]|uniref:Uncharacterized protein n=1 Tax=hydrothermal vent metagenome TaxID=652676 RepID=A0A3B1DZD1_9ZZZZ